MAKRFKVTVLLIVTALCLALCGVFAGLTNATAEEVWSDVAIERSYVRGEKITLPSRKLTVDGKEYVAEFKVITPDGKATSAKDVTLEKIGKYSVQYYVLVDGVPYSDTVSFIVNDKAYAYSNEETSVSYGTGDYEHSPDATGLYVKLKEQDVLEFNKVIEIPTVNEDISLLTYFIAPSEIESADFTKITFTLTDVADPSCYLRIVAQSSRPDTSDGRGGCYILAGGNGQQLKGIQGSILHVNNIYGARFDKGGSFYGYKVVRWTQAEGLVIEPADPSSLTVDLKFNPVTREVKAGNTVIIDTDSKEHFGGATDVKWTGFTSGNVKLSVKCEGYNASFAGFVLTEVKDIDLSSDICKDEVPPEITVISDYDTDNMPFARAGVGEYYAIPKASAYDLVSGECAVTTYVYSDYGTESEARVNVKEGKFETVNAGSYAIVYVAYDDSGNKSAEKIIYVTAKENLPEMIFSLSGLESSYEAGSKVVIPLPKITGGSGNKTVTARVYSGDNEYTFDMTDGEWAFFPETAGKWTIEYTATDYTGHTAMKTYELNVLPATAPSFRSEAVLPKVFVAGLGNRLPELTAYDYTSGKLVTAPATVTVTDKNGTKSYTAGDVFVPEVENNGDKVTVTYKYDNGKTSVVKGPYEIPAVLAYENDNLAIANYFYDLGGNTPSKKVTDSGIRFVAQEGEHSWLFANALVANGFGITFGGVENACVFDKTTVTLTDLANAEEKVNIEFVRADTGRITFNCSGVSDSVSVNGYDGENGEKIQGINVGITRDRLFIGGYVYDIDTYANGSEFKGFSSGKVNLTFTATGMENGSVYYVSEINSYTITRARQDRSSPNVSLTGDYGGFYAKGAVYTLCSAVSADVLAPVVDFSVSVTTPDGKYAKSVDGVTLKDVDPTVAYSILLSEYGVYTVSYLSVENNAPKQNPNTDVIYEINVCDDEAPEYTVNKKIAEKVKVGTLADLPTFTVTDNLTLPENIVVYGIITDPNGRGIYVEKGSFRFDIAGSYVISYYFADEAGNTAKYSFVVTAEL